MDGPAYRRLNGPNNSKGCWGNCKQWLQRGGRDDDDDEEEEGDGVGVEAFAVTEVIKKLQKRLRTMNLQLGAAKSAETESMQRATAALREDGDRAAARGHIVIARQHRAHWTREHGKYVNLNAAILALKEAHRNADTARLYKHSGATLGALLEATNGVDDLMDTIRGYMDDVGRDSEQLAAPLAPVEFAVTVEEEIAALMEQQNDEEAAQLCLPRVPFKNRATPLLLAE